MIKTIIISFIFSFLVIPTAFTQSRSPAVEPVRGLSIDRAPNYKNHPGFNFKNGQAVSTSEPRSGGGFYAVLFMLALASMPFLMHVIFNGNIVPQEETKIEEEGSASEAAAVSSLQEFRDKKTDDTVTETVDEEIKKAS